MVGADGGVFTFGDAKFEGSCPSIGGCAGGTAVAVMPDATGNGYWVVTAGGDVRPSVTPLPPENLVYREWSQRYGATMAMVTTSSIEWRGLSAGDAVNYGNANGSVGGSNPASAIFTTADGGGTGSCRRTDR